MSSLMRAVRKFWYRKVRNPRYKINVQPETAVREKPFTFLLPTAYDILTRQGRKPLSLRDVRAVVARTEGWSARDLDKARDAIASWKRCKDQGLVDDLRIGAAEEAALFYAASVVVAAAAMERAGVDRPLPPTPNQLDQLVGSLGANWPLRQRVNPSGRNVPLREVPENLKPREEPAAKAAPQAPAAEKPLPQEAKPKPAQPKGFWGKVGAVLTWPFRMLWKLLKWLWQQLLRFFRWLAKLLKLKPRKKGKADKQDQQADKTPPSDGQQKLDDSNQPPNGDGESQPDSDGEPAEDAPKSEESQPAGAGEKDEQQEQKPAAGGDEAKPEATEQEAEAALETTDVDDIDLNKEEQEAFEEFLEQIRKQDPEFWENINQRKAKQREKREQAEAEKQRKQQEAEQAEQKAEAAKESEEQALENLIEKLSNQDIEMVASPSDNDKPNYNSHGGVYADVDPKLAASLPPKLIRSIENRLEKLLKSLVYDPEGMDETPRLNPRKLTREIVSKRCNLHRVRREEMAQPMIILAADVSGSCEGVCKLIVATTAAILRNDPSILLVIHSNGQPEKVYGQMAAQMPSMANISYPEWWAQVLKLCAPVAGFINFGDSDAQWLMKQVSESPVDLVWLDHGARYSGKDVRQLNDDEYAQLEKQGVVPLFCCANVRDAATTNRALGIALERSALRQRRKKVQRHRKRYK